MTPLPGRFARDAVVVQPLFIARRVCKEVVVLERWHCIPCKAFIMALQKQHGVAPGAVHFNQDGSTCREGLPMQPAKFRGIVRGQRIGHRARQSILSCQGAEEGPTQRWPLLLCDKLLKQHVYKQAHGFCVRMISHMSPEHADLLGPRPIMTCQKVMPLMAVGVQAYAI